VRRHEKKDGGGEGSRVLQVILCSAGGRQCLPTAGTPECSCFT